RSFPTSNATASKTSADGASRATRVATRRSAVCSSASIASVLRDSALTIVLIGELRQRLAGLRIRDGRRDELREPLEPLLCVGRKLVPRVDRHCPPETAVDDDWTGDLREVAVVLEEVG